MIHICSNCNRIFYHSGKYCSERCGREVRKYRWQIWLAGVVGLLVVMFANYAASGESLFSAPCRFLSASGLRELPGGDTCANGIAKVKSMAKPALPEEFSTWAPASIEGKFDFAHFPKGKPCLDKSRWRSLINRGSGTLSAGSGRHARQNGIDGDVASRC